MESSGQPTTIDEANQKYVDSLYGNGAPEWALPRGSVTPNSSIGELNEISIQKTEWHQVLGIVSFWTVLLSCSMDLIRKGHNKFII